MRQKAFVVVWLVGWAVVAGTAAATDHLRLAAFSMLSLGFAAGWIARGE